MKSSRSSQLSLVLTSALVSLSLPLFAKPTSKASPAPNPGSSQAQAPTSAAPADPADNEILARWLVEQNGGKESIKVPFAQVVKAATGKTVSPINPSDTKDAAIIAKIGGALDQLLPRMNRPDSMAHMAARDGSTDDIAERFEEQLRTLLHSAPAPGSGEAAEPQPGAHDSVYPALQIADPATGKAYYLAVALFPTGKRELITRAAGAARALTIHPADTARRITADGCCLLVGIEYDGKVGLGMAFLNWELIDLAPLALRLSVTFDGEGGDFRSPGAIITDGRKGRD